MRYATYSEASDIAVNKPGQMLLEEVNEYIQDRQSSEEEKFVGNWLLIAHWDHVHPSPHGEASEREILQEELERVKLMYCTYVTCILMSLYGIVQMASICMCGFNSHLGQQSFFPNYIKPSFTAS